MFAIFLIISTFVAVTTAENRCLKSCPGIFSESSDSSDALSSSSEEGVYSPHSSADTSAEHIECCRNSLYLTIQNIHDSQLAPLDVIYMGTIVQHYPGEIFENLTTYDNRLNGFKEMCIKKIRNSLAAPACFVQLTKRSSQLQSRLYCKNIFRSLFLSPELANVIDLTISLYEYSVCLQSLKYSPLLYLSYYPVIDDKYFVLELYIQRFTNNDEQLSKVNVGLRCNEMLYDWSFTIPELVMNGLYNGTLVSRYDLIMSKVSGSASFSLEEANDITRVNYMDLLLTFNEFVLVPENEDARDLANIYMALPEVKETVSKIISSFLADYLYEKFNTAFLEDKCVL